MSDQAQAVVLIHGLWMKPWTWFAFRKHLINQGYRVYRFAYPTTQQAFDKSTQQLAAFVNSRTETTVHMVGHSMGGLLATHASSKIRKKGRLVMLASPINGSKVAQSMSQKPVLKHLLKHAQAPLSQGLELKSDRPTMMVMGDFPYGFGRLVYRFDEPSDGTVAVASTEADWLTEHHVIDTNHLGILKNSQAKQLTSAFLQKDLSDE